MLSVRGARQSDGRRTRSGARPIAWLAAACALGAFATAGGGPLGFAGFVTPGLASAYARLFGAAVPDRISKWRAFAQRQASAPSAGRGPDDPARILEMLGAVNNFFNRVPYSTDLAHWGTEDFWATPAEMVASGSGDCEDYSIAKYFLLKELGVPVSRLRMTYVKAERTGQAHMVLAYYAAPGAEPLILDNLEEQVRAASDRPDLVPVYSFNDDEVILVRDSRKASSLEIRAWRELIRKLEAETRL